MFLDGKLACNGDMGRPGGALRKKYMVNTKCCLLLRRTRSTLGLMFFNVWQDGAGGCLTPTQGWIQDFGQGAVEF